jgi:hypothetical protein
MQPSFNIFYSGSCVTVEMHPDCKLTQLSYSLESAINYFLGCGHTRWYVQRRLAPNNFVQILIGSLEEVENLQLQASQVTPLSSAVQSNLFPKQLSELWEEENPHDNSWVSDGQNKIKKSKRENVSIIVSHDINPQITLGLVAYGLADMITGLFCLGSKYVKWQGSLKSTQLYIHHNLSQKELLKYFADNKDYDVEAAVSTLTWEKT